MNKWLFNIFAVPVLYFISALPFWLLYRLSDCFFVLVYVVIGYRKKVVTQNLINSFPEKTPQEIADIRWQFYRHFCDTIFETIKLLTISKAALVERCGIDEISRANYNGFIERGQSVVGLLGHLGNWEWGAASHQTLIKGLLVGAYHPLSNKNFDHLMLKLRCRFGACMVPMRELYKQLLLLQQQGTVTTVGLIADQTPPPNGAYWTTFLNQATPVFNGPEKLARKFNYPVVYQSIKKIKRGYYRVETQVLTDNPRALAENEISERYMRLLEKSISEQPYVWLWSHRRWKHKKPA